MNAILIETSGMVCSAALVKNGTITAMKQADEPMQHATFLPQFIQQFMEKGIKIDVVAISGGPGSYTGLRIGASTAKGLCYATGAKLIAVNTLELIAAETIATHKTKGTVIAMIDARRMEAYVQPFGTDNTPLTEPEAKVLDNNSFNEYGQEIVLCGSGAEKCRGMIRNATIHSDVNPIANDRMLTLVEKAFVAGRFEDVAYYEPFYLKEFYTNAK